ncbi:MAG: hypothetical protein A2046_04135 [Bacteroidetes bacterium GWA2_30_7]|nr:MAG: hypothetical protein A2046_04135 [Bacteroidetes bacterium GWA2_30_7]
MKNTILKSLILILFLFCCLDLKSQSTEDMVFLQRVVVSYNDYRGDDYRASPNFTLVYPSSIKYVYFEVSKPITLGIAKDVYMGSDYTIVTGISDKTYCPVSDFYNSNNKDIYFGSDARYYNYDPIIIQIWGMIK